MAIERKWQAITLTSFTADGTQFGVVTIADTVGFKTKQKVFLVNNASEPLRLMVKRVISPTQLVVGPINSNVSPTDFTDISAYTTASMASIGAEEQPKSEIPEKDHYSAVYETDPIVADRVILVDQYGNFFTKSNPIPIIFDGTISIGKVEVIGTNGNTVEPNPDGSVNVVVESIPSPNTTTISKYNEIVAIPANSTATLVTYTVPVGKSAILIRCAVSGDNVGKYDLLINSVKQDTVRTMFGGDLTQMFDFSTGNDNGLILSAGDIITVQVLNPRPYSADYNARIQVVEVIL